MDPAAQKAEDEAAKLRIEVESAEIAKEKAKFEAQQQRVQALTPDFSKVDPRSVDIKGEQPLFGTVLARQALDAAAQKVASAALGALLEGVATILVTSDAELATSDGVYWNVSTALNRLNEEAQALVRASVPAPAAGADAAVATPQIMAAPVVEAAADIAAKVVPGLIALLAAHRTVAVTPITPDDLGSAAAVAGALKQKNPDSRVLSDDFRLLASGAIDASVAELITNRGLLAQAKVRLVAQQPEDKAAIAALEGMLSGIDTFVTYLTAVPVGAARSPLATAVLREQLHPSADGPARFSHVLLIKADGGSTTQEIQERWLVGDQFTVIAAVNIVYTLISTTDSQILTAGVAVGRMTGHGHIGKTITFADD
jgi:hypothetical protein